jgi:hypothetical protein
MLIVLENALVPHGRFVFFLEFISDDSVQLVDYQLVAAYQVSYEYRYVQAHLES